MASNYSPQEAQACERWLADKVLMDLLDRKEIEALRAMGDVIDINTLLRAQGVYKSFGEMKAYIRGGAAAASQFRTQSRGAGSEPSIESIVLGTNHGHR